jgi:hypothetical protein
MIAAVFCQVAGIERAPAFGKFLAMEAVNDTTEMLSLSDAVNKYADGIVPHNH